MYRIEDEEGIIRDPSFSSLKFRSEAVRETHPRGRSKNLNSSKSQTFCTSLRLKRSNDISKLPLYLAPARVQLVVRLGRPVRSGRGRVLGLVDSRPGPRRCIIETRDSQRIGETRSQRSTHFHLYPCRDWDISTTLLISRLSTRLKSCPD